MKKWKLLLVVIAALALQGAQAQNDSDAAGLRLLVDPSSTSVSAGGTATLTVNPLRLKDGKYVGDYSLKVSPYFFKSQSGSLVLIAPDADVKKVFQGQPVEFTGTATNNADGKTKAVKGKITPAAEQRGAVTFSITTDNGAVVFDTSYRFAK